VTFTDKPTARTWYRIDDGFLGNLLGWLSRFLSQIQDMIDTGGPAVAWLIFYGQQMGVQMSPVLTHYPSLEIPEDVSRIMNVDLMDDDFCRGVITSPIWVE
jgi:hypothetical protein